MTDVEGSLTKPALAHPVARGGVGGVDRGGRVRGPSGACGTRRRSARDEQLRRLCLLCSGRRPGPRAAAVSGLPLLAPTGHCRRARTVCCAGTSDRRPIRHRVGHSCMVRHRRAERSPGEQDPSPTRCLSCPGRRVVLCGLLSSGLYRALSSARGPGRDRHAGRATAPHQGAKGRADCDFRGLDGRGTARGIGRLQDLGRRGGGCRPRVDMGHLRRATRFLVANGRCHRRDHRLPAVLCGCTRVDVADGRCRPARPAAIPIGGRAGGSPTWSA